MLHSADVKPTDGRLKGLMEDGKDGGKDGGKGLSWRLISAVCRKSCALEE